LQYYIVNIKNYRRHKSGTLFAQVAMGIGYRIIQTFTLKR
jgi:hypothetical protein